LAKFSEMHLKWLIFIDLQFLILYQLEVKGDGHARIQRGGGVRKMHCVQQVKSKVGNGCIHNMWMIHNWYMKQVKHVWKLYHV
jgi:hypothetical protein